MGNEFQPYVGPRPFEREDSQHFFGRERESSELLSRVVAHPAVLLYSQSGAGKTSLLNASLIPMLEKEGFEVLPTARVRGLESRGVTPDDIPNVYAFNVLLSWNRGSNPQDLAKMRLAEFLETGSRQTSREGAAPRIAVFDQFEELFTFYPERWSDREDFFDQVGEALEADRMMRVIFVMREDYIAELDPYVLVLPEKLRTRFRLERLREESALEAIKAPLTGTGYSFAEGNGNLGVAEQLVNNLLKVPVETVSGVATVVGEFVEPVQLQVVCQNLWQKLDHASPRVITHEQLHAFGDVDEALSDFYEDAIANVASLPGVKEGELRRWFEHTLITPSGTRGTVYRGKDETGGIPNKVVDKLVDQHVIRGELRGGARWYELTHDRLIKPIIDSNNQWIMQRSGAQQTRQLLEARAAEWARTGRPKSGLLDEAELLEATRWLESPGASDVGFSDALVALVQTSRARAEEVAHERERALFVEQEKRLEAEHARVEEQQRRMEEQAKAARRMRLLAAALAVMFLMSVGFGVFGFSKSQLATKQTRVAQQALNTAKEEAAEAKRQYKYAEDQRQDAQSQRLLAEELADKAQQEETKAEEQAKIAAEQKSAAEKNAAAVVELAHRKELDAALTFEQSGKLEEARTKYDDAVSFYRKKGLRAQEAELLARRGAVERQLSDYDAAEKSLIDARALTKEIFGPSSPQFATILRSLGELYHYQYVWKLKHEAEGHYNDALEIRKAFGKNDYDLMQSYRDLATLHSEWGEYDQAQSYYEEAIRILREILPDDPELADTLSGLANAQLNAGKLAVAEPNFVEAVAIGNKAADPDRPNPKLARTYQRLAWLHINQGKYTEAEQEAINAQEIQEKLLYGSWHDPDFKPEELAVTINNRALVFFYQNRYSDAEPLFKQALKINTFRYGDDNKEVATLKHNLGTLYEDQGKYDEALRFEQEALKTREEIFGVDGGIIANSLRGMGYLYLDLGKFAEAEKTFLRARDIVEKRYPAHGIEVAYTLGGLASTYTRQEKYAEAEKLYNEVLGIWTDVQGAGGIRVAGIKRALATIELRKGNFAKADSLYRESLEIYKAKSDVTGINSIAGSLAAVYREQGRFAEAEPLFKEELATDERLLGMNHPDVGADLSVLSGFYADQNRLAEAEAHIKRALEIDRAIFRNESSKLATDQSILATVYRKQGKVAEAEEQYQQALATAEKLFGPTHSQVATTLEGLAKLYLNQNRLADAGPLLKRALAIRESKENAGTPAMASVLNDYALLCLKENNYDEAEALLKRALAIREKFQGSEHPYIAYTLDKYALLMHATKRDAEAVAMEARAKAIRAKFPQLGPDN
jgi:tetratricopeptide (TPR) repeat protein